MMQVFPKLRNLLNLEASITQSIRATAGNPSTIHFASFHSTDAAFEKWKNKFNFDTNGAQPLSKSYIRYAVRQKRADTKKALKNLLFDLERSTSRVKVSSFNIETDYEDKLKKKSRIKPVRQARRAYHKRIRRKDRRERSFEDPDEYTEKMYQFTFTDRCFNWNFRTWETGFESRTQQSNDESTFVGAFADRRILGLPPDGPLKIEDVKANFRMLALKWHPDKHQGPSQENAEEKFKNCVNAYQSLCNALSNA